MGLKRYIYKSGLDIIAPLKCGTRWLEGFDVENRIRTFGLHPTDLPNHIHSGTTFIWRPVREHFISAIRTELVAFKKKDILGVISEIQSGECGHWYPHLYRDLYPLWEKTGFRFHKLRALSELTPSAGELKWTSNMYKFDLPTEWDSVEAALSSIPSKHLNRLNKLIGEEEKWLKSMLQSQYVVPSWETYSDLEDLLFTSKCKVRDLEAEVELFDKRLKTELDKLYIQIRELKDSNTKLQAKLDYAESIFGKLPIKLI
jgi:hypothetical protein